MTGSEPVDFCRVKKINEKGFGFLRSQYYEGDVFFHFTQIKREEQKSKLEKLKRGEFFLFFTSKQKPDNKRKVDQIWYEVSEIPPDKIPGLIVILLRELDEGKTNLFDLLYVFGELKKNGYLDEFTTERMYFSRKIMGFPTTIIPYLTVEETENFLKGLRFREISQQEKKPFWFDDMVKLLNEKGISISAN
ncbi:MAG: cold shock domain-containing protein [Ignavibacteriales bacterium]|nr:MAG: hypothetical protein F9K26_06950 [Ignavibacteriaceae bacterium]MBW7873152.1 cold shock domain-containing protein [Ignavibacteria bacterium]MCZ2142794.1 cold shock domain-containing protein [Ignavibacteriales bacterium]MBV6443888.1 hypothetical protein [Ignavibacteriaceae bacterium]MBZ0196269.1 cold shock domain-containing protein [Ignavibacteriaceae bacterium]